MWSWYNYFNMWKKQRLEFKVQIITWAIFIIFGSMLLFFRDQLINNSLVLLVIIATIFFVSCVALSFFYGPYAIEDVQINDSDYFKKNGELFISGKERKLKEREYLNKYRWPLLVFFNLSFFIPMSFWLQGIFDNILFNFYQGVVLIKFLFFLTLFNIISIYIIKKRIIILAKFLLLLSIAVILPAIVLFYGSLF